LGWINFVYDWKWQDAEAHVRRAIALNPSYAPAHSVYSGLLVHFRKDKEAIAEMQIARRLDPLSLSIAYDTVWNMFDSRQYDLVLQQAEKTLSTDADFSFANSLSGMAYALRGVFNEAITRAKRGANPTDSPVTLGLLGEVYARAGQTKEAEQILEQLQGIAAKTYVCHHDIAALQAILGHKEKALESLDEAHRARSDCMAFLPNDPRMDPLRGDARFEKLLQEIEAGR
jgi:tetratricopeptide (TPR) repeat protein